MYPTSAALITFLSLYSVTINALPVASNRYARSISVGEDNGVAAVNEYLEKLEHPHSKLATVATVPAPGGLSSRSELDMDLYLFDERDEGDEPVAASEATGSEPAAPEAEVVPTATIPESPMAPEAPPTSASVPASAKPENHHHHYTVLSLNGYLHHLETMRKARLAAKLAARDYYGYFNELD